MSFVTPAALLLLLPLTLAIVSMRWAPPGWRGRLPGGWDRLIARPLAAFIAARSRLGTAGPPVLASAIAAILIVALGRPGVDASRSEDFATLAGRVVVLDVGSDLSRHRLVLDELHRADPLVATSIVAVAGDAYRIVPFTTDKAQIDRYVRVLEAGMMPEPGHRPHRGLARAERILDSAGYLARQVVFLSARLGPVESVAIPAGESDRFVVALEDLTGWQDWAASQEATMLDRSQVTETVISLSRSAREIARAELPASRFEMTGFLIALAAALWLLLFRRRTA